MSQISFFEGTQPFKIRNKIRLIQLFAGYGSQALALKYLGVPYEDYKICEWAVKSIQAYKDLHCAEDDTDYSATLADEEIIVYRQGSTPQIKEEFGLNIPDKVIKQYTGE